MSVTLPSGDGHVAMSILKNSTKMSDIGSGNTPER